MPTTKKPTAPSATRASRLPVLEPPGALLYWLSNSISTLRVHAAWTLVDECYPDPTGERLRDALRMEWVALGDEGPQRVIPLAQGLREEYGLLAIELMAIALALQGEDGVTELLALSDVADFSIRSKVAIGLGALGASARWAVPRLIARLRVERFYLVEWSLLSALGKIGGREAEATLEQAVFHPNEITAKVAQAALAELRSLPAADPFEEFRNFRQVHSDM